MSCRRRSLDSSRQSGVALILVLVFTLLLNLMAATLIESATLQSRMAGSGQFHTQALVFGDGIASQILSDAANFPDGLPPGQANCAAPDLDPVCVAHTLRAADQTTHFGDLVAQYRVVRKLPESTTLEVNEVAPDTASQPVVLDVQLYEIEVRVSASSGIAPAVQVGLGVAVSRDGRKPFAVYWRELNADAL